MATSLTTEARSAAPSPYAAGAAYVDGAYMPIAEARIPITDWGYRRSDVTYDVVGVWGGAFFRLDDHIRRFRASMTSLRLNPKESDDEIRDILARCVRLTGLREAYVAMDCLRGRPVPGQPYHPAYARNYLTAFVVPWIWLMPEAVRARGAHMIIASTPRIPDRSVDASAKNFHWGDLTRGLFEAHDAGADTCVLLNDEGFVTEGPGFNVFAVNGRTVISPDRNVLHGVTRLSVQELCDSLGMTYEERAVRPEELREADEVFIATTAGGIMPVSRVDGRILSNDRPGPIYTRLHEAFWSQRAAGWHATPVEYEE